MIEAGSNVVECFVQRIDDHIHPLGWAAAALLRDQGLPMATLARMAMLMAADGHRAADGLFVPSSGGREFIAFYEKKPDDVVFWCPAAGEIATWLGRVFALGEDNVRSAGTYAFDKALHIYANPLDWLKDGGRGIVVVRWDLAFDMLRDVPRVAVAESLLPLYRRNMNPCHLPELSVLVGHSVGVTA